MAWQYDAPSNTYRNHALSSKIRNQAVARAVFMPYLTIEPGFGKRKGESVTITRILRLPLAGKVGETERLPRGRPVIETKQVNVAEWGFALPVTNFERDLTHFDIMNQFQSKLREQIELTMDVMAADALKLTPVKYTPLATAAGFDIETDGSAAEVASRNLMVQDLREIHDYLHGELKCPPFANGKYVGVLSTRAARGIKNDPEYKDWFAPNTSEPLESGKLRDVEGFTLVETNNYGYELDALDNLSGTSDVLGEAIFFGADAAGLLQVQAPDLRMGVPDDLGRWQDIGWVGILNAFHVWERPSLARAIHVTSA